MKLKIKRIDTSLPLPVYKTSGAIGFDMEARVETVIRPQEIGLVPLNLIVKIPKGHGLLVVPRSSTPRKKGLLIPHGIGVIDQDYCGDEDELMLQVFNFTKKSVTVERGERIAQGVIIKVDTPEFVEVATHGKSTRGGFGSTG